MKILYISSQFPEVSQGANIYTDLAEALFAAGHEITVAVAEQARNKQHNEMKRERGFNVLRIITGNYYDVNYLKKGITTLKMPLRMRQGIKENLRNRVFDFILFESPPVTYAGLIEWAKQQFNCPAYLMLKDIFPQNAVDLGIIKANGLTFRYFRGKEKKLYQTADYIGCMSAGNKQYVIDHNTWLNPAKVEVFPNAKKVTDNIKPDGFPMRDRYGIPTETCVFIFGGNMGKPQYVELLCEAIKQCKDEAGIYFLFVGRGTERYKLEQTIQANEVKNALVLEDLPRPEYEQLTKECDVGLIVLDPRFTIPNYPSRILSYMEYAKPMLAATDKATDLKALIKDAQCGEWVWSGDAQSFVSKVREMAKSEALSAMGSNGRKYLEDKFNLKTSVAILEKHFR